MSDIIYFRNLLLEEIGLAVKTTINLIHKVKDTDWNYRPNESMRSLHELVHHLVKLPAADLAILNEGSSVEISRIENANKDIHKNETLANILSENFNALKIYFSTLNDIDFKDRITKAFYSKMGKSQAQWLIEITTHIYHHRAQFFNYLKQLNYEVTMFDLY